MEDVPGDENFLSFKESDTNNSSGSSSAYLDTTDGREVPMFHYNWETCQDMPLMVRMVSFDILAKFSENSRKKQPSDCSLVLDKSCGIQ